MESLSPLIRSPSVRRLSLELCQKFASNLLSSPGKGTGLGPPKSQLQGRRASYSYGYETQQNKNFLLSPIRSRQGQDGGSSGLSSINLLQLQDPFDEPKPRTPPISVQVIPPTPRGRRGHEEIIPDRKASLDESLVQAAGRFGVLLNPQEVLGKGSFGTVFGAKYKGRSVAVKVLHSRRGEKSKGHLRGELNALSLPPHPQVVSVLDVLRIPTHQEPPSSALVILERMGNGNLYSLLNESGVPLDLNAVVGMSRDVASALQFCHSKGILHLDVKPQNILIAHTAPFSVKLSDFGNSKSLWELKAYRKTRPSLDGTVAYTAPELFQGESPTPKCDVYSLAITMWQILYREQPYLGETEHSLIYKVVAQGLRPRSVISFQPRKRSGGEATYIKIYEKAWDGFPQKRQTMDQLYHQLCNLQTLSSF